MRILDQTGFPAEFTAAMDGAGRAFLCLVVKGSFAFPETPRDAPEPADAQRPLVHADSFTGMPGFSATLHETDFAFRKHRCDVLALGAAHAPGGRPAERVRVGLRVGEMVKQFDVLGHRTWRVRGPVIAPGRPEPFLSMPFSYDTAFGGTDRLDPDDETPPACPDNPVGRGFATVRNQSRLDGTPMPNTESPDDPVRSPYGSHRPMALGPIGRGWPWRIRYAGTYDQAWIDETFPFLPADFDERYYQSAPEDQQIDKPAPGTEVVLLGLTPRGREAFRLPDTELPLRVFRSRETVFDGTVRPDTLVFDCEARVFTMTWRIDLPIRRDITEFTEAWIGPPTAAMERARRAGRAYLRDVATGEAEP